LGALPCFDVQAVPHTGRELAHFRWSQKFRGEFEMWAKGVVDIENWQLDGRALGLASKPGESIVIGNIGALGYYAPELVVYDTQGLTNREPLLALDPAAREMPGHDRKVEIAAFEKYLPTYYNARIVSASEPWKVLPKSWQTLDEQGAGTGPNEAIRAKYDFELVPLDEAQGFRPDSALLLIRFRR
ncbi:MAG: hypothetical protein NTV21_16760, partial [Planctomycetota bacterium]|nr:hypothetical protein [Planctomycetota bacterium]